MCKTSDKSTATPQDIERLFSRACQLHEKGKPDEALILYKDLLSIIPNSALLHFNYGLALFELGLFVDAELHYGMASEWDSEDPDIHYNRGLNFRRLGKFAEAAQSFEDAFKAGDTTVDTLYNLALCYQDLEEYSEAERLYVRILTDVPEHLSSLNNYAYLCHKSGQSQKAEQLYRQLLHHNPHHQAARHMIDSLSGNTPETAPLDYVESVFDNYADEFEQSLLNKLQYRTPTALKNMYNKVFQANIQDRALDLGCGTGLAGTEFKDCCEEIIGMDISEKMLSVASSKQIYKQLVKDDILHFLTNNTKPFSLILAADVFTYMGNLEKVFIECLENSVDNGLFLFSVEESQNAGFELKTTGRFGHSQEYINSLSKKTGWTILEDTHSKLRKDKGEWINGFLFLLQKQPNP